MIPIQISGGHGMGKTTLARKLAWILEVRYVPLDPLAYNPEMVRKYDRVEQRRFVEWQIRKQHEYGFDVVYDRGPEDGCAYGILLGLMEEKECIDLLRKRFWPIKIVIMNRQWVERDFPIAPDRVSEMISELLDTLRYPYVWWDEL